MTEMVASLLKLQTLDDDVAHGRTQVTDYRKRQRRELLQHVPDNTLRSYKRLRSRHADAVVPAIDGTCQGCFVQLSAASRAQLADGYRGQVTCDCCGRILYLPDAE